MATKRKEELEVELKTLASSDVGFLFLREVYLTHILGSL